MLFIDGAYLDSLLKNKFGETRIDYEKLVKRLAEGTDLRRTYYYHCAVYQSNPPTPEEKERKARQDKFFNALNRLPRFQVKLGKLAFRGRDAEGRAIYVQKGVDIMLGVDMLQTAFTGAIERIILLGGDGDFVHAVKAVKERGILTVLWTGPEGTRDRELWEVCDERNIINDSLVEEVKRN